MQIKRWLAQCHPVLNRVIRIGSASGSCPGALRSTYMYIVRGNNVQSSREILFFYSPLSSLFRVWRDLIGPLTIPPRRSCGLYCRPRQPRLRLASSNHSSPPMPTLELHLKSRFSHYAAFFCSHNYGNLRALTLQHGQPSSGH